MSRKLLTIVAIYLTSVVLMALQKPLFLLWYAEQAAEASSAELLGVSLNGLLLDSTVAGYISAIPWLIMLVAEWIAIPEKVMRRVLNTYFVIIALIASLMVAVDFGLFRHWGFRLDSTILPYLATPKEAAASVTWSDLWPAVLLFVAYAALMIAVWRGVVAIYRSAKANLLHRILHTTIWIVVGGLIFLAIRGGTGTAPANVSKVYFSNNMFLNQAATNPIFSFLSSAARSELKEGDYRYFSDEECIARFEPLQDKHSAADTIEVLNTTRPNVVLVILESFGRTITDEIIDGKEVTPHLNALKDEGIWFENLFANSFRTDRGTVAIMSGYPTHPKVSVMKYPQKAHTLPAISRSLHKEGYTTRFTYGGDANFTNTISYLYGTDIEQVTDQHSISLDAPLAQWGYADDVVCEYFADEVLELASAEKPFFATLLTLSSHEPFDVPYSAFENKILNAAAFTDECIGKMIERWKDSPAWDNMLVILIADHGIAYPEEFQAGELPRQRIPMLWTGGALKQRGITIGTYSSQADLAATLLHQMNIPTREFTFSKDILNTANPHYGFWSFNNGFGIISPEGYVRFDCTNNSAIESSGNNTEQLTLDGESIVQMMHQDLLAR
ncbi:MAG: LTA synthase family protein [Alistipes sp.]|nr:LTA synthase family protein [Alistipes sp.]